MKLLIVFSSLFVLLLFVSCSNGSANQIQVSSTDYEGLTHLEAGEFDPSVPIEWDSPAYAFGEAVCRVSLRDDRLVIANEPHDPTSYCEGFDHGYFIGVDLGEFDGWVRYYPYYSTVEENAEISDKDGVEVANKNCRGIIKISNTHGYILTGSWYTGACDGQIYEIRYDKERASWMRELVAEMDEYPCGYFYDQANGLYIVTTSSIRLLDQNGDLLECVSSNLIKDMAANSIVRKGDTLYCGSCYGVYAYNLKTQTEVWYSMDFDLYTK